MRKVRYSTTMAAIPVVLLNVMKEGPLAQSMPSPLGKEEPPPYLPLWGAVTERMTDEGNEFTHDISWGPRQENSLVASG